MSCVIPGIAVAERGVLLVRAYLAIDGPVRTDGLLRRPPGGPGRPRALVPVMGALRAPGVDTAGSMALAAIIRGR